VILLDANILMYAAGTNHSHKTPSLALLDRIASGNIDAAINTEVLQEILRRYRALGRWDDGRRVYDLTRQIFPTVIPITAAMLDRARDILDQTPGIMARDAVHASVVMIERLDAICSYDRDFDRIAGIRRIEPEGVVAV
jgi:predicted nucleic acid-binding protein